MIARSNAMLFLACAGALAPTRRVALRHAAGAAALSLTTAQRAAAATNAEAEKVRVASRELNELLKNEDALRFKVLVEGSGTDSASVASPPPARHRRDSRCRARRQATDSCELHHVPEAREGLRRRFHGRGD
jgi:hypothetical protein